jgi:hypothetical protein
MILLFRASWRNVSIDDFVSSRSCQADQGFAITVVPAKRPGFDHQPLLEGTDESFAAI